MAGYMERCTGCGCWTDATTKAAAVCDDCQRAVTVTARAGQPPDAATLKARVATLEALLLEARTAMEPFRLLVNSRLNWEDDYITAGHIRRAAEVYAKLGGGQGD